ncbi:type III secretion system inner membrane ring subunit SctD (plasmid) [Burkholderia sp. FERM BP-3421]|uniref:type III secretion system inner membrane ring subunit SctD n=1 Tax=Burkholderia sp. FERM BP-3421 TaxID=1494466 RepID=UPI00235E61EF|nr:type III secretion system inner membrane ring subunit SctD [Burkholderia sp. FERM BP-3421]WDD90577.1 type III secretion system inner membrane ring subunit SctD [Burkholderia sp. FERM BP-3421]
MTARKLRWLNGPLAGHPFVLPDGPLRIGGADADLALVLDDEASAVLNVGADGVTVSPGVPVWVAGARWDAATPLPEHVVVDLAGLAFIVGGVDDPLPVALVPPRHAPRARRPSGVHAAGALACAGLLGALVLALWQPAPARAPDLDAWLAARLRASALHGLRATREPDGTVGLSGSCALSQAVEQLRGELRARGVHVRDTSQCADTLRGNVKDVLMLNGYRDIDVRSTGGPGSVEIHGAIAADGRWRRTVAQLQAVAGLRTWQVINDRAQQFERLLDALSKADLLDGVGVSLAGRTLMVSGKLDEGRTAALNAAIAAFNRAGADGFTAIYDAIPTADAAQSLLPAPVVTVGGQANSIYVVLANGMRLQVGGVLPNGYAIVGLSRHAISLRNGEHLVSIPLDV